MIKNDTDSSYNVHISYKIYVNESYLNVLSDSKRATATIQLDCHLRKKKKLSNHLICLARGFQFKVTIFPLYIDGLFCAFVEVPQFIIQQRVDPAYDGGKPIWETPAVVYASGSVASIGVIILGIRKCAIKRATSRFVHLKTFSLNFSSSSFAIRVTLVHP